MRTPKTIAADLAELHDKAAKSFVPPDIKRAAELASEFAASVSAVLESAGLMPAEPAEEGDQAKA